jgi:hypothetical protein
MAQRTAPWTPDELAQIEQARLHWLAVGTSTEPAKLDEVQAAWDALYRRAGRAPVRCWLVPGPRAAHKAIAYWSTHDIAPDEPFPDTATLTERVPFVGASWWGAHDAYWVGWYRTAEQLGVEFSQDQLDRLAEVEAECRAALWAWTYEGGVIVCDRPSICKMEEFVPTQWRLHCEDGPALAFRDGYAVYAWHGVRVSEKTILAPETLTVAEIDAETNAEVKRVMLDRFGFDRYVAEAGLAPAQTDACGTLYRMGETTLVAVLNSTPEPDGTTKRYVLPMPGEMRSAKEAVAWSFELSEEEYHPVLES